MLKIKSVSYKDRFYMMTAVVLFYPVSPVNTAALQSTRVRNYIVSVQ